MLQYDRNNVESIYDLKTDIAPDVDPIPTRSRTLVAIQTTGDCSNIASHFVADLSDPVSRRWELRVATCSSVTRSMNDRTSLAYVTCTRCSTSSRSPTMSTESWEHDDALYISGKISGDGTEHKPWWMEGNAVFSHLHYSSNRGTLSTSTTRWARLWTPTELFSGRHRPIPEWTELYNVTWESDWAVGYQVGACCCPSPITRESRR